MPVKVNRRGDKFRVVESGTGRIATNAKGTAIDGGGHISQAPANRQASVINSSKRRK